MFGLLLPASSPFLTSMKFPTNVAKLRALFFSLFSWCFPVPWTLSRLNLCLKITWRSVGLADIFSEKRTPGYFFYPTLNFILLSLQFPSLFYFPFVGFCDVAAADWPKTIFCFPVGLTNFQLTSNAKPAGKPDRLPSPAFFASEYSWEIRALIRPKR